MVELPESSSSKKERKIKEAEQREVFQFAPVKLLLSLQDGNDHLADEVINKSEGDEKNLLTGMRSAWNYESKAVKLLLQLTKHPKGVFSGWAHLILASFYRIQGNNSKAEEHNSWAHHFAEGTSKNQEFFRLLVILEDSYIMIARGHFDHARNQLRSLLRECQYIYIEGIARYLLGSLGRHININMETSEYLEILEISGSIFQEKFPNRYYRALTNLELASLKGHGSSEAEAIFREASDELIALGRTKEAEIARSRLLELLESETGTSNNKPISTKVERIGSFLYAAPLMKALVDERVMVAITSDMRILILGPSGVGKSILAQGIAEHPRNPRHKYRFVHINCSAYADELFEATFFGYIDGAYTGAKKGGNEGLIKAADGGTLFIDEVGELSPKNQAKLLTFIETGEYFPVGSNKPEKSNVRIIAATNRNLLDPTADSDKGTNTFRSDLFYRLNTWPIYLPPLSERREDIVPIAEEMLYQFGEAKNIGKFVLDSSAKKYLEFGDYPGNIRNLRDYMENVIAIINHKPEIVEIEEGCFIITAELLSFVDSDKYHRKFKPILDSQVNQADQNNQSSNDNNSSQSDELDREIKEALIKPIKLDDAVEEYKKKLIQNALTICEENRSKTARYLGISSATMFKLMKKFNIT